MTYIRLIQTLMAFCVALAMATGCSNENNGQPAEPPAAEQDAFESGTVTVTDMMGRTVTVEVPVKRAVTITAANCEILFALDAGGLVVGRGEYCDYPEAVADIPLVQSGEELNIEQVLALDPDVVFMSSMAQTREQIEAFEASGISVIVTDAADIEGVYESIALAGRVLGFDEEADALIHNMRSRFSELKQKAAEQETDISVYFEVSPLEWGLWTAGNETFMDEIAGMLSVHNIFNDVSGWAEVSQEQVIQRNPDYILSVAMYFGDGPMPEEEILSRSGWQDIEAVKNGHVYVIDSNEFSRPGPRLVDAAEILFQLIYGQE